MSDEVAMRQELLAQIKARRVGIHAFIRVVRPRNVLLTNLSIICSALVAVLTAGPALGGEKFTAVVGNLFSLQSDSTVWRVLCLAGALLSIVAAVSTNLYKSHDVAARLSTAQACNNELEGLEALLKFGELPVKEAVTLYQKYIAEIPFIQEPTI